MINKFTSTYLQLQYRAFFMDPDFRIPIRTFADLDLDSGKKIRSVSGQKDPDTIH